MMQSLILKPLFLFIFGAFLVVFTFFLVIDFSFSKHSQSESQGGSQGGSQYPAFKEIYNIKKQQQAALLKTEGKSKLVTQDGEVFKEFMRHVKIDLSKDEYAFVDNDKISYPIGRFFQYRDIHIKDVGIQNLQKISKIIQKESKILAPYEHWMLSIEVPVYAEMINQNQLESETLMAFQKAFYLSEQLIKFGFPPHRLSTVTHFDQVSFQGEKEGQVIFKVQVN